MLPAQKQIPPQWNPASTYNVPYRSNRKTPISRPSDYHIRRPRASPNPNSPPAGVISTGGTAKPGRNAEISFRRNALTRPTGKLPRRRCVQNSRNHAAKPRPRRDVSAPSRRAGTRVEMTTTGTREGRTDNDRDARQGRTDDSRDTRSGRDDTIPTDQDPPPYPGCPQRVLRGFRPFCFLLIRDRIGVQVTECRRVGTETW